MRAAERTCGEPIEMDCCKLPGLVLSSGQGLGQGTKNSIWNTNLISTQTKLKSNVESVLLYWEEQVEQQKLHS